MKALTHRQQEVLDFIERRQRDGVTPSVREIAAHFKFRSPRAASDHLAALREKGYLTNEPTLARSFKVLSPLLSLRKRIIDIPLFGEIPAGLPEDRRQEAKGCISIDIGTVGIKPTKRTFALEVRGESMIGKNICDGDLVILEHGVEPRSGDVVAALIDNESTLKTFIAEKGKTYLRAENSRFPKLYPAHELVIQGVMMALVRKRK